MSNGTQAALGVVAGLVGLVAWNYVNRPQTSHVTAAIAGVTACAPPLTAEEARCCRRVCFSVANGFSSRSYTFHGSPEVFRTSVEIFGVVDGRSARYWFREPLLTTDLLVAPSQARGECLEGVFKGGRDVRGDTCAPSGKNIQIEVLHAEFR